jgi:hypothetical protein
MGKGTGGRVRGSDKKLEILLSGFPVPEPLYPEPCQFMSLDTGTISTPSAPASASHFLSSMTVAG